MFFPKHFETRLPWSRNSAVAMIRALHSPPPPPPTVKLFHTENKLPQNLRWNFIRRYPIHQYGRQQRNLCVLIFFFFLERWQSALLQIVLFSSSLPCEYSCKVREVLCHGCVVVRAVSGHGCVVVRAVSGHGCVVVRAVSGHVFVVVRAVSGHVCVAVRAVLGHVYGVVRSVLGHVYGVVRAVLGHGRMVVRAVSGYVCVTVRAVSGHMCVTVRAVSVHVCLVVRAVSGHKCPTVPTFLSCCLATRVSQIVLSFAKPPKQFVHTNFNRITNYSTTIRPNL